MLPAQLLSPMGYFPEMKNPDPEGGEPFAQRVRCGDLIYRWANGRPVGVVGSHRPAVPGGSLEDQEWTVSQRKR